MRRALSIVVVIVMLAVGASAQSVEIQPPRELRPLSAEDVLSAVSIASGPLSFSPDGRSIIYVVQDPKRTKALGPSSDRMMSQNGVPISALGTDIWLTDTGSGVSSNFTKGHGNNWSPCWSPDGTKVAFYSDRTGAPRLWLYERSTGESRQLSAVIVRPSDGDIPQWIDHGTRILTKILPEGESLPGANALLESQPSDRSRVYPDSVVTIYRANDHPQNDAGNPSELSQNMFTRARRSDLALIQVGNGAAETIAHGFRPAWYSASPNGSVVAFAHAKGQRQGNNYRNVFDLMLVEAGGKATRNVASDIPSSGDDSFLASFSPDGQWISYITLPADGPADCVLIDVRDGAQRQAARLPHPDFANQYHAPHWGADSKALYFIVNSHEIWRVPVDLGVAQKIAAVTSYTIAGIVPPGTSLTNSYWSPDQGRSMIVQGVDDAGQGVFLKIDLETGVVTSLIAADQSFGGSWNLLVGSPDGASIIYGSEDPGHSLELWTADTGFRHSKQLSQLNPQLGRYVYGHSKVVQWLSADGELLRGALVLPSGYTEDRKYPLVVFVYPGNQGSEVSNRFGLFGFAPYFNMQLLATRGYAVLYPDCPVHPGTIMQDVAKAVLPGVNKIIELGIADPARLGVIGESFGGYATLSLIVQTRRFKAAIMYAGLGNLISSYGEMGDDGSSYLIGVWENNSRTRFGSPWIAREKYLENSPVLFLDRVETPLLIVHGSKDFAVAPFLADEIFVDLRRLGKTVVYAKYEGEGHAINSYHNQLDFVGRMVAWLDEYLKTN
jgi:dipeptidyl aminopeptidase/acylaminoacyl peptidase